MIGLIGQTRSKVNLTRVPPWRRWVRGKETTPSVSLHRDVKLDRIAGSDLEILLGNGSDFPRLAGTTDSDLTNLVSSDGISSDGWVSVMGRLDAVCTAVPSLRRFLISKSPTRKQAVTVLDNLCTSLGPNLVSMTTSEKVKLLCAFGQLKEYSVSSRVVDRYINKSLSYENPEFFSALVKSVDVAELYSSVSGNTRTLAPVIHVLRSVNRMSLSKYQKVSFLTSIFDEMFSSPSSGTPSQLTELVMLAAKHRIIHPSLFEGVVSDIASSPGAYSEDLIGDIARSFTTVGFFSENFHSFLSDSLPLVTHELSWWNLVDIAEYYNVVVPKPRSDLDAENIARFANECWKWIPDMRSGYAAKALRVLSQLEVGDKRTIRSLIRALPRSLDKMHANVVAESLVAAARVGYDPRGHYGKRSGAVLYRRLSSRLVNPGPNESPLESVNAELIVAVIESLAGMNRPENELFDFVVADIKARPHKYSADQIVLIESLMRTRMNYRRGTSLITSAVAGERDLSVHTLARLARDSSDWMPRLMEADVGLRSLLTVEEIVPLLGNEKFAEVVVSDWIDANLPNMSSDHIGRLLKGFAIVSHQIEDQLLQVLVNRACGGTFSSCKEIADFIASIMITSGFQSAPPPSLLLQVCAKSTPDTDTIKLCQLIAGHVRLSGAAIDDSTFRFLKWIDTHLMSKFAQPLDYDDHREWYVPNGAVTDLSVFPVNIPMALPDPRIDLRKLHSSRTATAVRRATPMNDAGIAVMYHTEPSLPVILERAYLERLGWTVTVVNREADITDPTVVSMALVSGYIPESRVFSIEDRIDHS